MSMQTAAAVPRLRPKELERVVARATLAPSSHNTQPWRFRATDDAIALMADRSRALPVNDPLDRELTISCGCALFNLRGAAAEAGVGLDIVSFPQPHKPDVLARATLSGAAEDDDLTSLAGQIEHRRTCRGAMLDDVDPSLVQRVNAEAAREGARMVVLRRPAERRTLAALVERGDAMQWSNAGWRAELAAWMRPRASGDGLTLPDLTIPLARRVVRWLDLGRSVGRKDGRLVQSAPFVGILTTERDDPAAWLEAGQALQRVLLAAAQFGAQASYFNQPIQVPELRDELRSLCGGSWPQIAFRLGRPVRAGRSAPRRRLHEVLIS